LPELRSRHEGDDQRLGSRNPRRNVRGGRAEEVTMSRHDSHDHNPLGPEEKAILTAFLEMDVPAGVGVPSHVIGARISRGAGALPVAQSWQWESAYVSLEVRGLIEPGADPFSAITWALTPEGHAFVHSTDGTGLDGG
jgi:hypothetical protein